MALIVYSSSSFVAKKLHLLLHPNLSKPTLLSIKSPNPHYFPSNPITHRQNLRFLANQTDDTSSIPAPPPKKPNPTVLGFGSSSSSSSSGTLDNGNPKTTKQQQKARRERASIIRRTPVDKPRFTSQQQEGESNEQNRNESAFLLAWLGLGSIIIIEGILLAASGFLPEEWDKFFVNYLYPSFTPTVFLFVAGTVAYGVVKYLQNEKPKSQK